MFHKRGKHIWLGTKLVSLSYVGILSYGDSMNQQMLRSHWKTRPRFMYSRLLMFSKCRQTSNRLFLLFSNGRPFSIWISKAMEKSNQLVWLFHCFNEYSKDKLCFEVWLNICFIYIHWRLSTISKTSNKNLWNNVFLLYAKVYTLT